MLTVWQWQFLCPILRTKLHISAIFIIILQNVNTHTQTIHTLKFCFNYYFFNYSLKEIVQSNAYSLIYYFISLKFFPQNVNGIFSIRGIFVKPRIDISSYFCILISINTNICKIYLSIMQGDPWRPARVLTDDSSHRYDQLLIEWPLQKSSCSIHLERVAVKTFFSVK